MCDSYILKGAPEMEPLPQISLGPYIHSRFSSHDPANIALVNGINGKSLTFGDLVRKINSFANLLVRSGCGSNDVIAICSENCLDYFVVVIATLYIGATIVPINPQYKDVELIHGMEITKPKVVICSVTTHERISVLAKTKLEFIETILSINGQTLTESSSSESFEPINVDSEKIAFILASSGTTGLPKGVGLTHKNVMVKFMYTRDPRITMQDSVSLAVLPLFHCHGLFTHLALVVEGNKVVVLPRFQDEQFLKAIEDYHITSLYVVPPLMIFLAKSQLCEKYDLSSLRDLSSASASLSKEIQEVLKKRLNVKVIRNGYGLTETTLCVIGTYFEDDKFGTVGKIFPYTFVKVVDTRSVRSLPPNEIGEICIKGDAVMKGYINNDEANRNAFTADGWFLTGDLGYYDEENYLYVIGRIKELIKYKAYQIAPAEIEAVLLTHPEIKDTAVVGLPDQEVGELPLAFVVKRENSNLRATEVQQYVKEKLSPQKKLRGGVVFIEEIPKNPSGKILRKILLEMVKVS